MTHDFGASWSAQSVPVYVEQLTDIACPSITDCWATGYSVNMEGAFTPYLLHSIDAGTTWRSVPILGNVVELTSISCPNVSTWWAGGATNRPYEPLILATTDGGFTWRVETVPTGTGDRIVSLSCPTVTDCLASGYTSGVPDPYPPLLLSTRDGAPRGQWASGSPSTGRFPPSTASPGSTAGRSPIR